MRPEHADALFDVFAVDTDGAGWTYLPRGPFTDRADAADWTLASSVSEDPLFFTICRPDGAPIGFCSFLRIAPEVGSIEVGNIHFGRDMRGTKAATEAMALMMGHALGTLGYRRYEWKCDALNAPSRQAAERLGFTYEGTFRQATVVKGRNRDTAWFSVLGSEWPALKARFDRWLAPDNFDSQDRQIRPLGEC